MQLADDPQLAVVLDAFPGNMLGEGDAISAVLDFGLLCIVGDRRLDPLISAAYLAPEVTPIATEADRGSAREWLLENRLADLYPAAERWLAAFWSGAVDDPRLQGWSRRLLGIPSRA